MAHAIRVTRAMQAALHARAAATVLVRRVAPVAQVLGVMSVADVSNAISATSVTSATAAMPVARQARQARVMHVTPEVRATRAMAVIFGTTVARVTKARMVVAVTVRMTANAAVPHPAQAHDPRPPTSGVRIRHRAPCKQRRPRRKTCNSRPKARCA